MITEREKLLLDGKSTGIVVEVLTRDNPGKNGMVKGKYIFTLNNGIRLFKNLEVATLVAKNIVGNDNKFAYYISINGKKYPLNDCQKIGYYWNVVDKKENKLYLVRENYTSVVCRCGYIVFENGDTVRCDKEYGIKNNNAMLNFIKDICVGIFTDNDPNYSFSKIVKKDNEIILHIKGACSKIHILTNSQTMYINQARKEKGYKCLPFLKTMDKFTTFYFYVTKEPSESYRVGSEDKVNNLLNFIVEDANSINPDCLAKVVNMEYNKYIEIVEG